MSTIQSFRIPQYLSLKTLLIIFTIWFAVVLIIASKLSMTEFSHTLPINNNKQNIIHSKSKSNDESPGLPAFVVIGPPKSGTTSLVHTLTSRISNFHLYPSDNGEHHFWNGANQYECLPDYDNATWRSYIHSWKNKKVSLSHLNHSIWTGSIIHPTQCTKMKYHSIWQWIMCHQFSNITDKTCKVSIDHHKNKYCEKQDNIDSVIPYCYFVESAPSYLRNPLIGIMFAMNLPKVKLLGIVCVCVIYSYT